MKTKAERNKEYYQKQKQYRKENGLCLYCGKVNADIGYVSCSSCREKNKKHCKKYGKSKYEELKSNGICVSCGKNKAAEGHVRCQDCLDESNEEQRELGDLRKKAGICKYCKEDALPNRVTCAYHCYKRKLQGGYQKRTEEYKVKRNESRREQYSIRKEQGLCVNCDRPAEPGKVRCWYHLKDVRERTANYKHEKLGVLPDFIRRDGYHCSTCGSENLYKNYKLCERCYNNTIKAQKKACDKIKELKLSGQYHSTFYEVGKYAFSNSKP